MILISSLLNQEIFGAYEYGKMCADIASVISMGLVIECFLDRPDDLIKGLLHIELHTITDNLPETQELKLYLRSLEGGA